MGRRHAPRGQPAPRSPQRRCGRRRPLLVRVHRHGPLANVAQLRRPDAGRPPLPRHAGMDGLCRTVHERRLADPLARHTLQGLVTRRLARPARGRHRQRGFGVAGKQLLCERLLRQDGTDGPAHGARRRGGRIRSAARGAQPHDPRPVLRPGDANLRHRLAARHDLPDAGGRHARFAPAWNNGFSD